MTTPRTWRLKVANEDGQHLFTVLVNRERPENQAPAPAQAGLPAQSSDQQSRNGGSAGDEPRMTEPQKRYLFRLLAQQGYDGKGAEEQLRRLFQVRNLREVTKTAASQRIEQMLIELKEGSHGTA